ncbi:hypothetical protein B795N_00350 [Marinilactibacillus psychrotolerans]|uniref:hypothetical protein n=1 Tax=Marinilactibacillus psychrotolerans TaxID=191770 RepID=UPI001C7CBB80|nr:hypothetical protein [Marinilactibacillus psychrotolerans]GEQ32153.1 hypothetical protein B795N_00350 [Marinilactibacillus psychrotolerans]
MYNVWFKDKSALEFPLVTQEIGRRQKAEEEVDVIEVPYRNGPLLVHTGFYKGYERPMTFVVRDTDYTKRILAWLKGRGKLRTDIDPLGYFRVSILSEISVEPLSPTLDTVSFSFSVDPFFYLDSGDRELTLTKPTALFNPGTHYADPIITIYGSGNIRLNVNSEFVSLTNVTEKITMDSELKVCYRDTLNMGRQMTGEYLTLREGMNSISWEGSVTKVEITPRWREL